MADIVSFVSAVRGSGRTSVVANTAVVLASAGKLVLVVDLCPDSPRLGDYLAPFLTEVVPTAELGAQLHALRASDVHRHLVPGITGRVDVISPTASFGTSPTDREPDAAELRLLLDATDYDTVLIDWPSGLSAAALQPVALLSDAAVITFIPRARAIREAAETNRWLQQDAGAGIRVLAVATQMDGRETQSTLEQRTLVRRIFPDASTPSPVGSPGAVAGVVEIPYHEFGVFDELLAVLAEPPDAEPTALPAYERLARLIVPDGATLTLTVPAPTRRRYRRGLGLDSSGETDRFLIAYAAPDRPWADWISHQLGRAGGEVRRLISWDDWWQAEPRPTVVVVESGRFEAEAVERQLVRLAGPAAAAAEHDLLYVPVPRTGQDGEVLPLPGPTLDLTGLEESRARGLLLTQLALLPQPVGPQPPDGDRYAPRYPARTVNPVTDLPGPNPLFVGRDRELDAIRDALLAAQGAATVLVVGPAGAGKSEVARAYAHRYAYDYDVVWWIPAQDRPGARAKLTELANSIDPRVAAGGSGDAVLAALAALGHDRPSHRWLLIYDNLDDPRDLADLLPERGSGHVLVTSRTPEIPVPAPSLRIDIGPLTDQDSAALLRERIPALSADHAAKVAAATGRQALALTLAVPWILENALQLYGEGRLHASAVEQAAGELLYRLGADEQPEAEEAAAGDRVLARMLSVSTATLNERQLGRLTVRLAQMCAFLEPSDIALRLLRSRVMMRELIESTAPDSKVIADDALEFDRVIWTGARFGLFEVDWGRANLRMHRATQAELLRGLSPAERSTRQREVLHALSFFAPAVLDYGTEVDANYAELRKHLVPSGALEDDDERVRRWVVGQLQYLGREGDADSWASTLRLGEQVRWRWERRPETRDALYLRLGSQLANLYRALGRPADAHRLDEATQQEQRLSLGLSHLRTLATGRGKAGDLRGLGRFAEAYAEDSGIHRGFIQALGEDHPQSLMAIHNTALSSFLIGDVRMALAMEQDVLHRRQRLFGVTDRLTWHTGVMVSVLLRELGRYDEAMRMLTDIREWITRAPRTARYIDELPVRRGIAVIRRRTGHPRRARDYDQQALEICDDLLGRDHQTYWACLLSLASDHHLLGDAGAAVELGAGSLSRYVSQAGEDHPFTAVAQVNLACFQRGAGNLDDALDLALRARSTLDRQLDGGHPWTLAAGINLANILVARGEVAAAAELESQLLTDCRDVLGVGHPYDIAVQVNHRHTRALLQEAGDAADHPWRRDIDIDIPQT